MDLSKVNYRKVLYSDQSCLYVSWYVRLVDTNLVLKCLFRSEVSVKFISSLQFPSGRSLVLCLFFPPCFFLEFIKACTVQFIHHDISF